MDGLIDTYRYLRSFQQIPALEYLFHSTIASNIKTIDPLITSTAVILINIVIATVILVTITLPLTIAIAVTLPLIATLKPPFIPSSKGRFVLAAKQGKLLFVMRVVPIESWSF